MISIGFTASVVGLGVVFTAAPAHALTIVTSRSTLGGNDFIDWGTIGPDSTVLNGPFNVTSNGGVGATVQAAIYPLVTRTQGFNASYFGGFTEGERLLATRSLSRTEGGRGPISISFASPISAGGLQIESTFSGNSYTVTLEAFGTADNSLGSFSQSGFSNFGTGNPVFLGVTSDVGISRLVYSLPTSSALDQAQRLAINRFDFTRFTPPTTEVPVPPHALATGLTMTLAGLKRLYQKRVAN
jgi:hypothetical protein